MLGKAAIEEKDNDFRRAVIRKLTDPAILAKIKMWVKPDLTMQMADQALLAKIAVEAKDVDIRRAAVEKLTGQEALAKIAIEDEDRDVRRAAVEKLTDQNSLGKIAIEEKDNDSRRAAVGKLTDPAILAKIGMWVKPELTVQVADQALLAKIAVEAKEADVRRAAVEKLTGQEVLAKIAIEDEDPDVRRAAAGKLTDPSLLGKIATGDKDHDVRRAAVEKLTDQSLLGKIAIKDTDRDVARAAAARLNDRDLMVKVVAEAKWLDIRLATIARMNNSPLLRHWAEKGREAAIRRAVVKRIADDGFLIARLPAEPSAAVRSAIVATLRGKEALGVVARTAYHQEDRASALRRVQAEMKDSAPDLMAAQEELTRRVTALAGETDRSKLQELALKGAFDVLRTAAAKRLGDMAGLEAVARLSNDREVLKIVLAKFDDALMLEWIAGSANDPAMRLAAAHKAGRKPWERVFFDADTALGATAKTLGDALAAVALFPAVQSDATNDVRRAALSLIQRGDESRIPEMVDLLEGYGDKTLAEEYLNCGQPDLEAAGSRWASSRGYSVGQGGDSHLRAMN